MEPELWPLGKLKPGTCAKPKSCTGRARSKMPLSTWFSTALPAMAATHPAAKPRCPRTHSRTATTTQSEPANHGSLRWVSSANTSRTPAGVCEPTAWLIASSSSPIGRPSPRPSATSANTIARPITAARPIASPPNSSRARGSDCAACRRRRCSKPQAAAPKPATAAASRIRKPGQAWAPRRSPRAASAAGSVGMNGRDGRRGLANHVALRAMFRERSSIAAGS